MKVYNRIVIDMSTGEVVAEDSFDYAGPVAECKGGGSSTTVSVDKEYNARMAKIAEEQQSFSEEDRNLWQFGVTYDPNERVSGYMKDGQFVEGQAPATQETGYYDKDGNWVTQDEWMQQQGWKAQALTPGSDSTLANMVDNVGSASTLVNMMSNVGSASGTSADMQAINWETRNNPEYETVTKTRGELEGYDPSTISQYDLEQMMINANADMIPQQTDTALAQSQLAEQQALSAGETLPYQTERQIAEEVLAKNRANSAGAILPLQQRVGEAFYNEALDGINVDERVNQARADVGAGFAGAEKRTAAALGGMGVNPNSGRGRSEFAKTGLNYGRAISGASSQARRKADEDQFNRLDQAISTVG